MKNKRLIMLALAATVVAGNALANNPTITLKFSDPQGLCAVQSGGKTQFSFNYKYLATGGVEYYSGPTYITNSSSTILVSPPDDGTPHYFSDFEITDQGPCGDMDLDYHHLGSCYLTNLIPTADQEGPYSYLITLTPQATGNHTYGTDMYNLECSVEAQSARSK